MAAFYFTLMSKMLWLSQRDARWAKNKIGNTPLTVGRWGCTLTCMSMLSSFFGCFRDPASLAADTKLFNAQSLIIWSELARVFNGKMRFENRVYRRDDAAIKQSLLESPKKAVALEVANGSHWVVCVGVYGNDFYCVDPIDGKKKLVVRTFGNITGSAHVTAA